MLLLKSMSSGLEVVPFSERRDFPSLKDTHLARQRPKPSPAPEPTSNGIPTVVSRVPNEASRRESPRPELPPLENLKAVMDGQQKDINRILESIDSFNQDMKTVKASIDFLKFQQKTLADHETSNSPTELVENIDLLAKKVAHLGSKADENDEFGRELEAMRSRLEHLESIIRSPNIVTAERNPNSLRNGTVHPVSKHVLSSGETQEVPSSTINGSHSEPPQGRSMTEVGDSAVGTEGRYSQKPKIRSEQLSAPPRASVEPVTSDEDSVEWARPLITSAEKLVRAQKRRRLSSSTISSDRSGPRPGPQSKQPRIKGKPDWATKPNGPRLNDYEHVLTSDPEDSDYDPDSLVQSLENARVSEIMGAKGGISKSRGKPPVRLPTPEWEKPDWDGPPTTTNHDIRGRHTVRRGVSGRGIYPRRDSLRRQSSEYNNGDYIYAGPPQSRDNDFSINDYRKPVTVGPIAKTRDEKGRLLNPDGTIDGRSLRHERERKRRQEMAAQQQQQTQQRDPQAIVPATSNAAPTLVDAAALAAAGYVPTAVMTNKAEIHSAAQPETLNGPAAGHPPNQSTPSFSAAPTPQPALNGKHAGLMKQVFPWR
ncbi:MAG: hypothetical protein Q9222_007589 [Ikaeria aurantiellina]